MAVGNWDVNTGGTGINARKERGGGSVHVAGLAFLSRGR